MLKLCTSLVLGAFLIYGLDDLNVISLDEFEVIEKPVQDLQIKPEEKHVSSRFTDRIVQKRQTRGEKI